MQSFYVFIVCNFKVCNMTSDGDKILQIQLKFANIFAQLKLRLMWLMVEVLHDIISRWTLASWTLGIA